MIVSDAGPLIVLAQTNNLSILKELFETVNVPFAVYDEITVKEPIKEVMLKTQWIKPVRVRKDNDYRLLEELVDKGEAEAIILAKNFKSALLVDDAKARKYAVLIGVEVIGTLGLLKLAKKRRVISSVKDSIMDMLAKGYYIDSKLIALLLKDVDEA